jgi:alkylation response protein AidB-like acyl-CoA dehydrogenase
MTEADAKRVAENLLPELRTRAFLADEMRKVPVENIEMLRKSGLLQTIQPAACGGQQLSMRAHVDVISTIARGCNATAWVLGVYHAHSWMLGHIGKQAQSDVYEWQRAGRRRRDRTARESDEKGRWLLCADRILAIRIRQRRIRLAAAR